jgi:hypothetical protein
MRALARVACAVLALCPAATVAQGQDSVSVRHLLALDISRLAPFQRSYDVIVYQGDSATVIGTRDVSLEAADLVGGVSGWLLVEGRSGAVPAADSLYLAPDARPMRWSSVVGPARLAAAFVGDTLMGATQVGTAKQNLLLPGRPDLLVSGAMVELALGLLPLADLWRDSAAVLAMDPARRTVVPVELVMLVAEDLQTDSLASRLTFLVALRSERQSVLYWVDAETGAVLRMQQRLPAHVGSLLEYRIRPDPVALAP